MYVITGATGNTGRRIAQQLLSKGKQVRVVGRDIERLRQLKGAEPFPADLFDADGLTRAFTGAEAVYAMMPPLLASRDYQTEQEQISISLATALRNARVPYVVSLSSVGADKPSGTGPVAGLHQLECLLDAIPGLNTLHLRAAYFMENTLAQIGNIRAAGAAGGSLRGDLKIPMIATRDISAAAADELLRLSFSGHNTRELLGAGDYSMNQVTSIIGDAIGKSGLKYVQVSDGQLHPAMVQMGMAPSTADLLLEMSAAINSGHLVNLEPRSTRNTTPTTCEMFVAQEFVPAYRASEEVAVV